MLLSWRGDNIFEIILCLLDLNRISPNYPDSGRGTTYPTLHQVNPEPGSSVQSNGRALRPLHDGHGILQGSHRAKASGDHLFRHRVSGLHDTVLLYVSIFPIIRGTFKTVNLFAAPSKRRTTSGATSVDSPCSSRASVAGSAYSEPWSGLNSAQSGAGGGALIDDDGDSYGGTNMVLRKRISKITRGMKK